jgi:hypothetical protein
MKLFISYRRKDSMHAAQRVRMCLQMKFGAEAVFIDRQIPAGKDWSAHLGTMLEQCSGVIVLVGDAFLRELHTAALRTRTPTTWCGRSRPRCA